MVLSICSYAGQTGIGQHSRAGGPLEVPGHLHSLCVGRNHVHPLPFHPQELLGCHLTCAMTAAWRRQQKANPTFITPDIRDIFIKCETKLFFFIYLFILESHTVNFHENFIYITKLFSKRISKLLSNATILFASMINNFHPHKQKYFGILNHF